MSMLSPLVFTIRLLVPESLRKVYRGLVATGASGDEAADAVQDALEEALRLPEPGNSPEGWLFVRALCRWRRTRWREREDEIDLLVELGRLTERSAPCSLAATGAGPSRKLRSANYWGFLAGLSVRSPTKQPQGCGIRGLAGANPHRLSSVHPVGGCKRAHSYEVSAEPLNM